MNIRHWFAKCCTAFVLALPRWVNYKIVGLGLLALDIAWFGNVLSMGLGHTLHVLIQVVEISVEHFLENAFDLTPRQAQFIIAYGGLIVGIGLFVYATRRALLIVKRAWLGVKSELMKMAEEAETVWSNIEWNTIVITLGAIGATLMLFT